MGVKTLFWFFGTISYQFKNKFYLLSKNSLEEDLNTDQNKDGTAENAGLAGQTGTELLADGQAAQADGKRHHSNDQRAHQSHDSVVLCNGKAYAQRVDGCGHALHQ